MLKKVKLQTKMILMISMTLVVFCGILFSMTLYQAYKASLLQGETIAEEISMSYASSIQDELKEIKDIGLHFVRTIEAYRKIRRSIKSRTKHGHSFNDD